MNSYHIKFLVNTAGVVDAKNAYVKADSVGSAEAKALEYFKAQFPCIPATEEKEEVKVEVVINGIEKTEVILIA